MFCIVYGFSNAALHNWHTPSTWGFLAAGVILLAGFGWRQARAPQPLIPPRIVLDRTRGGAYLTMLIAAAGMFGVFLFLTYYIQQTLGFSPAVTGVAFLPMIASLVISSVLSNMVLMPRTGPRPLAPTGMLVSAAGLVLLTRIGVQSSYATAVLPSLLLIGLGFGLVFAPVFNSGTSGVGPRDAGVASATINTGQQLGGSIGTSLLNTIYASAVASYTTTHLTPPHRPRPPQRAADLARPGPRLQRRLLVVRRHPCRRRHRRPDTVPQRAAARPGQPRQFQPSPDAAPVPDAGRPLA